ncbi:trigger factor [Porphyrobacter sp. GA68]|uniref:trigger factor n=1 Tax=Porphyrobacter sp. GA68 TaxID=2883480 RepID=UPI001D18AD7B|nr:trigger factor [Porphyrobacter sp. GA68]
MDIQQTTDSGLKRGYRLRIPAQEIDSRIVQELRKIAPQVRMPGFRPGKVPANLVRKMHGEQLHAQVLNDTIRESIDNLLRDKQLRPAMQPKVELGEGYENGKDAELTVEMEVLPQVNVPDVDGLKLERLAVAVKDEEVNERLDQLAGQNKSYTDAPKARKAQQGDQLLIDFVGRVDGTEFEGGKAEGATLVLGSGTFIPGFEDQLAGVKAGDVKTITVTFPADYPAENLKGKEAEFDVTVQAVKIEGETKLDDDFAKQFGLESMDKLREIMRAQMEQELAGLTRTQMKRALLDQLAADHDFAVPENMVEAEFAQIWAQLEQEAAKADDPAAAKSEIEGDRDDYRRIAERRVRLGLLLSEIGQANNIQISNQEMNMLIQQAAQQYRAEDRQRFIDYVQQEPMAAAQLRAPLYEDKVVDFLFDKAQITDREVTREELEAAIEADEGEQEAKPATKKKAPAKKAAKADGNAPADQAEGGEAAKKPAAKKAGGKKSADAAGDAPRAAKTADEGKATKAAPKKAAAKGGAKKTAGKKDD